MKLGLVSAILDGDTYEQALETATKIGFQCLEVACWPHGPAQRRYAGVCHIDANRVLQDDSYAVYLTGCTRQFQMELSALAYYPNVLDADPALSAASRTHLITVLRAAAKLGVGMVTTFIGRGQHKSVEDNLTLIPPVWEPILEVAEALHVKIAIENCPMLFDRTQWPGGQNLMTTPAIWERVFSLLPSPNLGLNYDPSHFVWQQMDYIQPLYRFREKLFHIHFKDLKIDWEKLKQVGTMAYPLEYMRPKLPGLGDVDWGAFISALSDIGYDGYACLEVEDRAFEGSRARIEEALVLSKRYLEQYVI